MKPVFLAREDLLAFVELDVALELRALGAAAL